MQLRPNILLVGGSGLLGKELQKLIECSSPSRKILDINKPIFNPGSLLNFNLIVLAAAYTDVVKAETEKELCYQTNVIGTRNLASLGIPMLYISTEYVFDGEKGNYSEEDYPNPQNFYAFTKLLGEYEATRTRSVIIRCLFKANPFKHGFGCVDQFTSGDYVDCIAKELSTAIKIFDKLPPILHIGSGKKSTFDLGRETRDIKPIKLKDIKTVKLPRDTSLNCSKWEKIKNENNKTRK